MSRPLIPLLVVVLAAASGCGGPAGEKDRGPVYVALGDSYTAGPGIPPVADARCGRSAVNYPSLVAKALKVATFVDRSCGGARTSELDKPQMARFVRLNDPQSDALDADTTLVTVGIGLNNGLISTGLLLTCLTSAGDEPSDQCTQYLSLPESVIEAQLKTAATEVEEALESIALKAPRARIVLVGYPRLVPDQGTCPDRLPVPEAQISRMRNAMRFANLAWREAAEGAGALYVDMYGPSEGHDICSDDPWISDAKGVPGQSSSLHPFASYEKAVAARIVSVLAD
jgi:lysophospholipase L1-like esterase